MKGPIRGLAKLIWASALAAMVPTEPGHSLIVRHAEAPWITEALASGKLDQKAVDLMHRDAACRPAGWAGAMSWLELNSLTVQTVPDFGNDVFKFKVARGILKTFPEVEVTIRMRLWTANSMCQIEIEQYGHERDIGLTTEEVIRNAKIFAEFKTYMLSPVDSGKQ
jgi:hypothetical protein